MTDPFTSPLQRAYQRAAQADALQTHRPPRLHDALLAHDDAANLFAQAELDTDDDGVSSL